MAGRGNPNWVKGGASPNPSGRPKGLGETIRAKYGEGEKLIEWMSDLAQNADKDADRIAAIKWLSEHGYGKPIEHVEHTADESLEAFLDGTYPRKLA